LQRALNIQEVTGKLEEGGLEKAVFYKEGDSDNSTVPREGFNPTGPAVH